MSSDINAGYTACYQLLGPTGGALPDTYAGITFSNAPGDIARLLIADNDGTGNSQDLFTLTGVTFVPTTSALDSSGAATVNVVLTNIFDAAPNPGGTYVYGIRTGGYFTPGDGSTFNDFMDLSAIGNFGAPPSGAGSVAISPDLSAQVGIQPFPGLPVSFDISQVTPFTSPNCQTGMSSTGLPICSPTITHTFLFVLFGTDSMTLANSADGAGGDCNLTAPVPGGPPSATPAHPCMARHRKITNFFARQNRADAKSAGLAGAQPLVPCDGSEGCSCLNPFTCATGTIKIVSSGPVSTYNYTGTGAGIPTSFSNVITPTSGPVTMTFSGLAAGAAGGSRSVTETTGVLLELSCSSANGTSTFSTPPGSTATVSNLGAGDTVTCTFNNGIG